MLFRNGLDWVVTYLVCRLGSVRENGSHVHVCCERSTCSTFNGNRII